MTGSILIYGNTIKDREKKSREYIEGIHESNVLRIGPMEGKKSIGIEQVREATAFLSKKPTIGDKKAIVVLNADKFTIDAQNAFLKTLEEPPSYATIILSVKTQEALLPTINSRCQRIFADAKESGVGERVQKNGINLIKKMSVEDKFTWSQETAKEEKDTIIDMLEEWVNEERENLAEHPKHAKNIRIICKVKEDLEKTNLNTRLALDYLTQSLV